jgi:hypothetical protein
MFAGTPLAAARPTAPDGRAAPWKSYYIEWLNVRYEQDVVSTDWSADQVEHQLALIDDLREATSSPAALRRCYRRGHRCSVDGRTQARSLKGRPRSRTVLWQWVSANATLPAARTNGGPDGR